MIRVILKPFLLKAVSIRLLRSAEGEQHAGVDPEALVADLLFHHLFLR